MDYESKANLYSQAHQQRIPLSSKADRLTYEEDCEWWYWAGYMSALDDFIMGKPTPSIPACREKSSEGPV